eukprot:scaffold292906_cov20-Prasinocladus_malaysianus.AAC.1
MEPTAERDRQSSDVGFTIGASRTTPHICAAPLLEITIIDRPECACLLCHRPHKPKAQGSIVSILANEPIFRTMTQIVDRKYRLRASLTLQFLSLHIVRELASSQVLYVNEPANLIKPPWAAATQRMPLNGAYIHGYFGHEARLCTFYFSACAPP